MHLLELFKRVAPWKWIDRQVAEFEVGENDYEVMFYVVPSGELLVGFGMVNPETGSWEEGNTGTGSELVVFSTVVDIMKDFAEMYKPESVVIPARFDRERVYTRMINRIAPSVGYELGRRETGEFGDYGKVVFLELVRQDLQQK